MILLTLEFKSDKKASDYEHYPSILVSSVGKKRAFQCEKWSIFVGKQKHPERRGSYFYPYAS